MSIITRIKSAAKKTDEFITEYSTEISLAALTFAAASTVWVLNALVNESIDTRKRLANVEYLALDTATHPRHTVENEDGSFSVTRLSKRNETEDTPV